MTGPEHYAEAEKLLKTYTLDSGGGFIVAPPPDIIALAQVHATLAQVAAAINTYHRDVTVPDWTEAIT